MLHEALSGGFQDYDIPGTVRSVISAAVSHLLLRSMHR
ncbi:hypothetical protein CES86_5540 [Brucella lupini]|uniref:Uncharacterized protein n=1 Tax=Brucella lupini TaxID=255457 RepID=A0A256GZU7_9HYPH|nr:hypothetical protein CES86_5540 [Brucella lupini]